VLNCVLIILYLCWVYGPGPWIQIKMYLEKAELSDVCLSKRRICRTIHTHCRWFENINCEHVRLN
jgi:hypothetical protein